MSTFWIAVSCVGFLVAGAWAYAKCTSAERKAGREALEAKLREQHRLAEQGRRRNEEALRRKEVIEILDWILRDPEVLKRRQHPDTGHHVAAPALYELTKNVKALENIQRRVECMGDSVSANRNALQALRENQKDIMKALQLGQPVE